MPSHNFGLIPASDLKGLKNISYGRWKDIHEKSKLVSIHKYWLSVIVRIVSTDHKLENVSDNHYQ